MIIFIILFIILSLSFFVKIKFKISQEEAIFVATFGMILFTFILGLVNLLGISIYLIGALSIFSFVFTICKLIKKEIKISEIITLPTIIYMLVMLLLYYFIKDSSFGYYDEYMFWGTNLKEMIRNSCLWANSKIDGIHITYPPFTAISEYLVCMLNNGFSESLAYLGIDLLMITSLMPLLKNENYSFKSFFKIILIFISTYISIVLFSYNVVNLAVDCILGIIFAVSMFLAYSAKNKKDYIILAIMLISLTLIKTNGILYAGITVMQIFLKEILFGIKHKNIDYKRIFIIVVSLFLTVILTFDIWNLYCKVNGKAVDDRHDKNNVNNIDVKEFITLVFSDEDELIENSNLYRNKKIINDFCSRLLDSKIIRKFSCFTTIWVWGITNVLYIVYMIISKDKLKKAANFISINVGFLIYLVTNLIMFIYVFQYYQGETLMSLERYIGTYLLAMILNGLFILSEEFNLKNAIIFVLMFYFITPTKVNQLMLDPRMVFKDEIEERLIQNAQDILTNTDETDKIYIIDQKLDYGLEFMKLKYLISSRKTNLLYEWNIGLNEDFYYRLGILPQDLINKMITEGYNYVYFANVDNDFLKQFKSILTDDAMRKT